MTWNKLKTTLAALTVVATLATATVTSTGCYGQFAVTKKVYDWNGRIGNKFVRTLAFWGLVIIPVYAIVMLGDGIIFNVIEFWGGSNPVAAGPARVYADGSIGFERAGQRYRIVPRSNQRFSLMVDGQQVASGKLTADGGLIFSDERKQRIYHFTAETLEQLRRRIASGKATPAV